MRYVIADTAVSLSASIQPPTDDGVVAWTLLDNTGSPTGTGTLLGQPGDMQATLTVPAVVNGKLLPTESRFAVFDWVSGGNSQTQTLTYVLIDFLPLRIGPAEVRAVLGANLAEIGDADVDLPYAAATVSADVTPGVFMGALTAGDASTATANRMVALRAALDFLTSLPLRIAQSMGNDQAKFARMKVDPDAIMATLRLEYERLRDILLGITDAQVVQPVIFGKSIPGIDAIRGPLPCLNFPPRSPFFRP